MEKYKNLKGVNQSSLKEILKHPSEYLRALDRQSEPDEEKEYFIVGKLVDLSMYDPEEISKKYVITDLPDLSDILKSISSTILETMELEGVKFLDQDSPSHRNIVLEACKIHNYYNNRKDDTRIDGVFDSCEDYINVLSKSKGKTIVSSSVNNKTSICKASLLSDFRTRKYFSEKFEKEFIVDTSKDIQMFKHVILQFNYMDVDIKAEMDQVVINHKSKQIIPVDLKTFGRKIYLFKSQFFKLRYDFQAAVYMIGLKNHPEIIKLLEKGYEILNFRFIVVESDVTTTPLIFEVTPETLKAGIEGGTTKSGYEYEGFNQAIERLKYHKEKEL